MIHQIKKNILSDLEFETNHPCSIHFRNIKMFLGVEKLLQLLNFIIKDFVSSLYLLRNLHRISNVNV